MSDTPTIAALLTPPGRGAVATVGVYGSAARRLVGEVFEPASKKPTTTHDTPRLAYGRLLPHGEDVVVCFRAEKHVEIHCHGGHVASNRALETLAAAGAAIVSGTEFLEAMHGRQDPIRTEALKLLAQAATERVARVLLDQVGGALRNALLQVRSRLDAGDVREAQRLLELLSSRSSYGVRLTQPWRVVLAGAPNVGKSSLMNRIVGYDRSIVYQQPGTTRDAIRASTAVSGWPVELVDTAGLRFSEDAIEQAGISVAERQFAQADLILLVVDAAELAGANAAETEGWLHKHLDRFPKAVCVFNKIDLLQRTPDRVNVTTEVVMTSAVTREGMDLLLETISKRLVPDPPAPGDAVPFTLRQAEGIQAAWEVDDPKHALETVRELLQGDNESA